MTIYSKRIEITSIGSVATAKKRKRESDPPRSIIEANKILDALSFYNYSLSLCCKMASLTGLRYSDASWLIYSEFFNSNGTWKEYIQVVQQKTFNMRMSKIKNNQNENEYRAEAIRKSIVNVYLNDAIKELVEEANNISPKNCDLLFSNDRSKITENDVIHYRPLSIKKAIKYHELVANDLKLSINLGTHSWRKFFANQILKKSKHDVNLVKELLGHSNISSTSHYLSNNNEDIIKIVNKMII